MNILVTNSNQQATIDVELDGRSLLSWQGSPASLDVVWSLQIDPGRLGLYCNGADVEFREATLEMLNGRARQQYESESDDRFTRDQEIDVLPLIHVDRDTVLGDWESNDSGILSGNESGTSIILAPIEVEGGSYEWAVDFTPVGVVDTLALILPTLDSSVIVELNSYKRQLVGLSKVDDKAAPANETSRQHGPLKVGQAYCLKARVTKVDGGQVRVQVALDNELLIDWRGDASRLSNPWLPNGNQQRPGIGTVQTKYQVTGMRFKLLEGEAHSTDGAQFPSE